MGDVNLPVGSGNSGTNDWSDVFSNDQAIVDVVNGGLDSDNFAPTAFGPESGLKWIRGIVDTTSGASNGGVVEGSGFTLTRNSTGDVSISFTTSFSDVPAVTTTGVGDGDFTCPVRTVTANAVRVARRLDGTPTDGVAHFIAVGPA